jgi:hypothetical protein
VSDADNAYPGSCTPWASYSLPELVGFLAYENDDLSWAQASTWQKTSELLDYYQVELKQKRDELAARWPPERSPAAKVFIDFVDGMLRSMEQTSAEAYETSRGVAGITGALAEAKNTIDDLHRRWREYENREKSPLVSFVDAFPGGSSLTGVPSDWKRQLKAEATEVMYAADAAVLAYTGQIKVPTLFEPPVDRDPGTELPVGDGGSGSAASPGKGSSRVPVIPIPPPVPEEPTLAGGFAPDRSGTAPPAPAPARPYFMDTPAGRALPPGGLIPPDALPPLGWAGPGPTVPGQRPVRGPEVPTGTPPERAGMPGRAGMPVPGEPGQRGGLPMAPMGGIASRPSSATGPGTAAGRRVNPVGGVIGGRGGESFRMASGHTVTIGPRPTDQHHANRRAGPAVFDPHNPWAVAEGVLPVIEPAPEPRYHDPGPGVIGIDR